MAGPKEKKIIEKIKREFGKKYKIETTVKSNKTELKIDEDISYRPDILFRDKKTEKIIYIIEVETDPVRKALVGAGITADYCMCKLKEKPHLLFLIGKDGEKQLSKFKARERIIKDYLKNIESVTIDNEKEIIKKLNGKSG